MCRVVEIGGRFLIYEPLIYRNADGSAYYVQKLKNYDD
ncbi:hypothetical protein BNJ_00437 [Kaumoebavirus]|nr:hypothetical protein BNJ_00437 [Kaumoebavirus]ARA72249.1 hypothetical protein BNJ_00437 [Kaumoebavirus]